MTLQDLRPELLAWLQANLPGVPAGVTIRFANPWTGSDGLTMGASVTLRPRYEQLLATLDPGAVELLCHELVHTEQFASWGGWWWVGYLLRHKSWEAQAYQRAAELRQMWEATHETHPGAT